MFQNALVDLQEAKYRPIIEFFKDTPLYQCLSDRELHRLAAIVKCHRYPINTLVLRQDDFPKSIYFIKSGIVQLLRKVDFKIPKNKKEANDIDFLV